MDDGGGGLPIENDSQFKERGNEVWYSYSYITLMCVVERYRQRGKSSIRVV